MPLSLNLPYFVCYPMVRVIRTVLPRRVPREMEDESVYFDYQYRSSEGIYRRYLDGWDIKGKVILDIGSGLGGRAPWWVEQGAERVVCVDINRHELESGRRILLEKFPRAADRVEFLQPHEVTETEFGDLAILVDVFEHLVDPSSVLRQAYAWLRPGGKLWFGSIGWYHYGATHLIRFIPIPWSQVFFSERALIRTMRAIVHHPSYQPTVWDRTQGIDRWDQVTTLKDRPGEPLNMLSLQAVRRVLAASPFETVRFRVHGYSSRTTLGRALALFAKVPFLNELIHGYYSVLLAKPLEIPVAAPRGPVGANPREKGLDR